MRQCLMTQETPGELPVGLYREAELWLSSGPWSEIIFPEQIKSQSFSFLPKCDTSGCAVDFALQFCMAGILVQCILILRHFPR